jgi:hypothetical protein
MSHLYVLLTGANLGRACLTYSTVATHLSKPLSGQRGGIRLLHIEVLLSLC